MIQSCIIIVPHPDDEINIGGGIIEQLVDCSISVSVVFTTNGDNDPTVADRRIKEAQRARNILGYRDIIILGYADGYVGKHLYEAANDEVCWSVAGHNETYNLGGLKTYHYNKYSSQSPYTRSAYKNDLKDLLLDYQADLVICVDNDKHPDHRCASLLFDEVIGELIKQTQYRPIILKKFAYVGVFKGLDDFFKQPLQETLPSYESKISDDLILPYNIQDKISFQNTDANISGLFWNSPIFRSLLAHKSQFAVTHFSQICNSDVCFWHRRTDNFILQAEITVSSGESHYINDFKIVDTDSILIQTPTMEVSETKAWIPDECDDSKHVMVVLDSPHDVGQIILYQTPKSRFEKLIIEFDNGFHREFDVNDSRKLKVVFEMQREVTQMDLYFKSDGHLAITEIELYNGMTDFPWDLLPLRKYKPDNNKYRGSVVLFCSEVIFKIMCCVINRLMIPIKRRNKQLWRKFQL